MEQVPDDAARAVNHPTASNANATTASHATMTSAVTAPAVIFIFSLGVWLRIVLARVWDVFGINGIDLMRGARGAILKISQMPAAGTTTHEISYAERCDFPESRVVALRLPTIGAMANGERSRGAGRGQACRGGRDRAAVRYPAENRPARSGAVRGKVRRRS